MTKDELTGTLRALAGTEAARAMFNLLMNQQERVKSALTEATGDEVLKLQGEYRMLVRLKKDLAPTVRQPAPPGGYD